MARIDLLPHITAAKGLLASIPERGAPTHKRAVALAVDALRARGGRSQFVGGAMWSPSPASVAAPPWMSTLQSRAG